jgi:hypothetical protein
VKKFAIISFLLMLTMAGPAFAQTQDAGAGENGFRFNIGYNGAYLHYEELNPQNGFVNPALGEVLDKDTGWLNGLTTGIRYDNSMSLPFYASFNFDWLTSDHAKYTGALQYPNGTVVIPYYGTTPESIYKGEIDLGYKIWNPAHFSLAPFVGIGYRSWVRGQDALPDYQEIYDWWYGAAGLEAKFRAGRLLAGIDAAALFPFSPTMKTNTAGTRDEAQFTLKSRVGYGVQVPVTYDISGKNEKATDYSVEAAPQFKWFVFMTPYYEHWNVGRSGTVIETVNQQPFDLAMEPKSKTDLYGVKAGLGVSY